MMTIRYEKNDTVFTTGVLEESFQYDPLSDLQKILREVEEWNHKYNTKDERKLYKFTDTPSYNERERSSSSDSCSSSVKTIDVSLNDSGQLNLDNLRTEINNSENEYIKIRVPSDVDLREIGDLTVDNTDTDSNNNNTEQKKKTRDREKTMAEYFV